MNDNNKPTENKQKRKYVKKSMMILRSNNDYIDHNYYAKLLEKSKESNKLILAKYGASPNQKTPV
jgi:beta-glucosidase/6-phospho-beta-glucosidase/beta-galactosidase